MQYNTNPLIPASVWLLRHTSMHAGINNQHDICSLESLWPSKHALRIYKIIVSMHAWQSRLWSFLSPDIITYQRLLMPRMHVLLHSKSINRSLLCIMLCYEINAQWTNIIKMDEQCYRRRAYCMEMETEVYGGWWMISKGRSSFMHFLSMIIKKGWICKFIMAAASGCTQLCSWLS